MHLTQLRRWPATFVLLGAFATTAFGTDFAGKTITYVIASKPGGGYDSYGRLIAKYMEKHLPGSTIVVKNVPGAGQLAGAQYIYASQPNGLTIGIFNTSLIYGQIAGLYGDKLDFGKLSWIGKVESESRVVMVRKDSPLKSIDDLHGTVEPLKIAVTGKTGATHFESALLAKILGWNLKPIFGFQGTETDLAVLRGDVDFLVESRSAAQHYVVAGDARFLLEYGGEAKGDVPTLDRKKLAPSDQSAFALVDNQLRYSRATAGPPGMDPEVLATLRQAYDAALADPQLLAEAIQANLPIDPAGGEEVQKGISSVLVQAPELVELVKTILKPE
ncbi:Bug family tripartite tricarboxylate transporter substrate binding protein [Aestuariivirga litoralis]|uniref:Bug family tripartite tricarboxylate transporter substrate binding protein n=1 Tax=Aestuariivirga litoralis TaxID=2650924 RepID=UPI0018C564CA|nr:tripartite tricarboxylate transporter substrate-binding protein [Aestuariivirga litoralis]MBG1231814.1 hypothetical protein [Aestuariivirga litoralis]